MKTIPSSTSSKKLYDPIRKSWVTDTPEEQVRQLLLHQMIQELGYPKAYLSIEKSIISLIPTYFDPKRRIDIVCFTLIEGSLKPLLLVECKAGKVERDAASQAFGYNELLKAPFLCLCGKERIETFWKERGELKKVTFLPSYLELCQSAQKR